MNNNLENLDMGEFFDDETKNELDEILNQTKHMMGDWDYDAETMSVKLKISFINKSNNPDPTYEKEGDSGFDIRAFVNKPIEIEPGQRMLIPTGLYFEIPLGYELQVRSRSGLALKNGIMVLNSPGTVDSGYRGEIGVILYNTDTSNPFYVHNGDRIAQGVIAAVQTMGKTKFIKTDQLSSSDRGTGGFGSTGIN
jgi:dUTP pyrophosphatase